MKCILVVDDDTGYLRLFRNFLLREGFEVKCAASADEALSILKDSIRVHAAPLSSKLPVLHGVKY